MNLSSVDWQQVKTDLNEKGWSHLGRVLSQMECDKWIDMYNQHSRIRKTVVMERYGYGQGEYRYFSHPLPEELNHCRENIYQNLADTARTWSNCLNWGFSFPETYAAFRDHCHRNGQKLATPLILKYKQGDFNCLHQDKYGDVMFPFQMVCQLSQPERDFQGGQFVLTKQRARQQAKVEPVPLMKGDAAIFSVFEMPVQGIKGWCKCSMKHGVTPLTNGQRYTLGVILHEAKT